MRAWYFLSSIAAIYKHMLLDKKFGLTHNLLATKVLPTLIPYAASPGLSLVQVRYLKVFIMYVYFQASIYNDFFSENCRLKNFDLKFWVN